MPDSPETSVPACRICGTPLGEAELALSRPWHRDCEQCHYCKSALPNDDQINRCLDSGRRVSHDNCHRNALAQDFKNKVIPITRQHIQFLNDEILRVYPYVNADTTDVSALYELLMSMQVAAANVSYALGMTKEQLLVRDTRAFDFELQEKRKVERAAKLETEKERLEKQARTERLAAEREDPRLRARRKAVEGLVAAGMPRETAESMIPQIPPTENGK